MDDSEGREAGGVHWTVQQFTTIVEKPWFALQKQNDEGVLWQFTGYRHEIDRFCDQHGITPETLPPIIEEEFFRRAAGEMPQEPITRFTGPMRWQLTT